VKRSLACLALIALLTLGCLGPKPRVRSAEVAPPEDGKAIVTLTIANDGGGDGQVEVKVTLRQGDEVIARDEKLSELKGRETIKLVLEVDVPDDAHDLSVDAEIHYPPD
jgi:hypothetical protein